MISAEIPNKDINPKLFKIVVQNNIHGPCGTINKNSPCMESDERGRLFCSKDFPKDFQDETTLTEYSYPKYRRRSPTNGGCTAIKMVKGKLTSKHRAYPTLRHQRSLQAAAGPQHGRTDLNKGLVRQIHNMHQCQLVDYSDLFLHLVRIMLLLK